MIYGRTMGIKRVLPGIFEAIILLVCVFGGNFFCHAASSELNSPAQKRTFLYAIREPARLAILVSSNFGQQIKFTGLADGGEIPADTEVPGWLVINTRGAGKYLVPVSEGKGKWLVCGSMYRPVKFNDVELKTILATLDKFRKMKPDDEATALRKSLLETDNDSLRLAIFDYLSKGGEFDKVISRSDAAYWTMIYFNKNSSDFLKQKIMLEMAKNNFMPDSPIFVESLKSKRLASAAGEIYVTKDRKFFKNLMLKWMESPELREVALWNSALMVNDPEFVTKALKHYKRNSVLTLELVPLLCVSDKNNHKALISELLKDKNPSRLALQLKAAETIVQINNVNYVAEMQKFIKNHEKHAVIKDSYMYFCVLAYLCRNDDASAIKSALTRVAGINRSEKNKRIEISAFIRAFRSVYNSQLSTPEQLEKSLEERLTRVNRRGKSTLADVKATEPCTEVFLLT
ncbi:MAG: hypothetical protein JXR78_17090 [Victivallales bacterium]|nr:hypothetical protein [Victivallales bacterium]